MALAREQDLLGAILEGIGDRFFAMDKDWRFTHFNAQASAQLRLLGKDPETIIGKVMWDEFPDSPVQHVFRQVMRDRTTVTHEHYYAPLDEWVENRICPSPDGGIAIFQRYVTERKRLDEERRRREAYLADAQALSHTGSWAWNPRTRRLTWSAEHYRIFGLDPTTVSVTLELGMSMIHADDRALVERTFATAVAERGRFALDCRVVRPNGEIRHVHSIGHPLFDDVGVFSEYVGAIIDTTERRRAEETLRNDERRLRQLTEAIPQHVWSYLPDGSLEYCNQRWLDYTGLTLEQAQGDGWTACLHPDDVEPVLLAWREAWSRRRPYETEYRMRGVDGRYRRFLSRAVLVCDEEGTLLRWFGTNTDIEDRRQAEEALHRAQADLAHVTRVTTMGELAASLAHALNQPLAAIATNAGSCLRFLGRDSPNLDKANVALACIVQDAGRAGEIIASTRAFLRKSAEERVPFDVNALIGEVLVLLQPEMRGHAVLFQPFLTPDLPPVAGSRVQLQQVVLNLIMNGIESMASVRGRGRDLVVRSSRQDFEGRPAVLVAVQDSGIGFDAQGPDRLFDAFYTTKRDGLGMGLSISRSAIEAHGGRLWATPNATGGATFQFILPAHGEPAP